MFNKAIFILKTHKSYKSYILSKYYFDAREKIIFRLKTVIFVRNFEEKCFNKQLMQPSTPCIIDYESPEYRSMCTLRDEVLRKPIGLRLTEEEIQRDKNDILLACIENGEAIACCILTEKNPDTVQLRQMAVSPALQQKGLGKELLSFAEKTAKENHYSVLCMHARKTALGFYAKSGYAIVGEEFTEVGIPHFEMRKKI